MAGSSTRAQSPETETTGRKGNDASEQLRFPRRPTSASDAVATKARGSLGQPGPSRAFRVGHIEGGNPHGETRRRPRVIFGLHRPEGIDSKSKEIPTTKLELSISRDP